MQRQQRVGGPRLPEVVCVEEHRHSGQVGEEEAEKGERTRGTAKARPFRPSGRGPGLLLPPATPDAKEAYGADQEGDAERWQDEERGLQIRGVVGRAAPDWTTRRWLAGTARDGAALPFVKRVCRVAPWRILPRTPVPAEVVVVAAHAALGKTHERFRSIVWRLGDPRLTCPATDGRCDVSRVVTAGASIAVIVLCTHQVEAGRHEKEP